MFLLLPLQVEDAQVDRVPWVSIVIASLCAVLFVATYVVPKNPSGPSREELEGIVHFWQQHPRLEMPQRFVDRFANPQELSRLDKERQKYTEVDLPQFRADPEADEAARGELDRQVDDALASSASAVLPRLALVPSRGPLQIGWLLHMFLHGGWLHLLGNLLFFYLVGPLLEDVWGRRFFLGFYLIGGFVAALAQVFLSPHLTTMMLGASGAIAACMGAFAYRFAGREIRMGYVIFTFPRFAKGTFMLQAWLWGAFWFVGQLFSLWFGGSTGVAVMAHVGGFAFGFAAALVLARSGWEAKHLTAPLTLATVWQQHEGHDRALRALEQGDEATAEQALREALAAQPGDRAAALGLSRLELKSGRIDEGMARAEAVLLQQLSEGDGDAAWQSLLELRKGFAPERLGQRVAFLLAGTASSAPVGLLPLLPKFEDAAIRQGGPVGMKALLRSAERYHEEGQADAARARLLELRGIPTLPPDLAARAAELERLVGPAPAQSLPEPAKHALADDDAGSAGSTPAEPIPVPAASKVAAASPATPARAVRVLACKLVSIADDLLEVEIASGQRRTFALKKIVAIGAGIIPPAELKPGATNVLLTDLILSRGNATEAPAALRIEGGGLGLARLYPGLSSREAYARLLALLLERTGAAALPDRAALDSGAYPRFASVADLNAALYS